MFLFHNSKYWFPSITALHFDLLDYIEIMSSDNVFVLYQDGDIYDTLSPGNPVNQKKTALKIKIT